MSDPRFLFGNIWLDLYIQGMILYLLMAWLNTEYVQYKHYKWTRILFIPFWFVLLPFSFLILFVNIGRWSEALLKSMGCEVCFTNKQATEQIN